MENIRIMFMHFNYEHDSVQKWPTVDLYILHKRQCTVLTPATICSSATEVFWTTEMEKRAIWESWEKITGYEESGRRKSHIRELSSVNLEYFICEEYRHRNLQSIDSKLFYYNSVCYKAWIRQFNLDNLM